MREYEVTRDDGAVYGIQANSQAQANQRVEAALSRRQDSATAASHSEPEEERSLWEDIAIGLESGGKNSVATTLKMMDYPLDKLGADTPFDDWAEEWEPDQHPTGIAGKVAAGVAEVPLMLARYGLGGMAGPWGMAGVGALEGAALAEEGEEVWGAMTGGATAGVIGKLGQAVRHFGRAKRAGIGAGAGGSLAAIHGGDTSDVVANAITFGGLMGAHKRVQKPKEQLDAILAAREKDNVEAAAPKQDPLVAEQHAIRVRAVEVAEEKLAANKNPTSQEKFRLDNELRWAKDRVEAFSAEDGSITVRYPRSKPGEGNEGGTSLGGHDPYEPGPTRPGHAYRGMEQAEYEATVGAGKGVQSRGDYSFKEEGTSFGQDFATAENYVNFGSSHPQRTGRPTYLVEIEQAGAGLKPGLDGADSIYLRRPPGESVPQDKVRRVWEMRDEPGRGVVARVIRDKGKPAGGEQPGEAIAAKPPSPSADAPWSTSAGSSVARAKAFDALPGDTEVTLFHATSAANAEALLAGKQVTPELQGRGIRAEGEGIYVGTDPVSIEGMGPRILAVTVKKSQVHPSPEYLNTATNPTAGGALVQGAATGGVVRGAPIRVRDVTDFGRNVFERDVREPPTPKPPSGGPPDPPPGSPPLPERATNILLSKYRTSDEVKRSMVEMSEKPGMEEARGNRTWEQDEQWAIDNGFGSAAELAAGGKSFNSREMEAGRILLEEATARRVALEEEVLLKPSTPERDAAYMAAIEEQQLIHGTMIGATADAGRTLRILAKAVTPRAQFEATRKIIEDAGGSANVKDIAAAMSSMTKAEQARFGKDIAKATTTEKVVEYYKAALLSGPQTHVANVIGNASAALFDVVEQTASAGIRTALGEKGAFREVGARLLGMKEGAQKGARLAAAAMKTEDAALAAHSRTMETTNRRAGAIEGPKLNVDIKGFKVGDVGSAIRLPFRGLAAMDQFFRTTAEYGERYSRAARIALDNGLKGEALAKEIQFIAENPMAYFTREATTPIAQTRGIKQAHEFMDAAVQHARVLTYTNDLGPVGQKGQALLKSHAGFGFIVPFFRTPLNLVKYGLKRTPAGFIPVKSFRADMKAGGKQRADAIARAGVGTAIFVWAYNEAQNGNLTGAAPRNPAQRKAWEVNNQGFSVKAGGKWESYARIEPLSTIFGLAAGLDKILGMVPEKDWPVVAGQIALLGAQNLTSKTYMRGVADFMGATVNPDRSENVMNRFIASFIPAGSAAIARELDPVIRDTDSLMDALMARIPGLRDLLPPKVHPITGETMEYGGSLGLDIASPIYEQEVRNDPVSQMMVDAERGIGDPQREFEGLEMNDDQYEFVVREGARKGRERVLQNIGWGTFDDMDKEEKADRVRKIYEKSRNRARNRVKLNRIDPEIWGLEAGESR